MYTGNRWRALVIFRLIKKLKNKPDMTEEEQDVVKAYHRILGGTFGLCILIIIAFSAFFTLTVIRTPIGNHGDKRYGTVQSDGMIRYVQNTNQYRTQDELGLSEYELMPGDRIVMLFDAGTGSLMAAYPQKLWDELEERMLVSGAAVFGVCIAVLLFYAVFICRATSWGKPLWSWLPTQPEWQKELAEEKEWKNASLGLKFAVMAVVFVLAGIILWPQISELAGNIKVFREREEMSGTFQEGMKAGQEAERMSENLQNIGSDDEDSSEEEEAENKDSESPEEEKKEAAEKTSGVEAAGDAAENIYDILSGMEQ